MYKLLYGLFILNIAVFAMDNKNPVLFKEPHTNNLILMIPRDRIHTRQSNNNLSLLYDGQTFLVKKDEEIKPVNTYDVDKLFKGKNIQQILAYSLLNKFRVTQFDNGQYAIHTHGQLKGGGFFGAQAGFFAGKFAVHFVAHGAILAVSGLTGPLAGATAAGLEATLFPFIEGASNIAAIGTAVAIGTLTGPM